MTEERQYRPIVDPKKKSIVEHALTMPGWQRMLLVAAVLLLEFGSAGQVASRLGDRPPQATEAVTAAPGNRAAFVSETGQQESEAAAAAEEDRPIFHRISPSMMRVGVSFIAAFVLGWAFRAFLKLMTMVAGLGLALILGLSYFNVINVDLTRAEQQYRSSISWVTDQGQRLGKLILSHLPSSTASAVGMFVGFRRK